MSCNRDTIHQKIESDTEEIFNRLVEIRRDLHQNPELAGDEFRTAKIVADYLTNLGLEVKTGIAGNGVIGILKGKKGGKNIAWRADMDAIPNDFVDDEPFKSKNKGIQHGCGHDVHMAIALGIAEVLSKNKNLVNGNVYFIFQPEEETFVGAKNMAESNWYSELNIDQIYALHVTNLPVGQIMVRPDELYAYQKILQFKFNSLMSVADANEFCKELRDKTIRSVNKSSPWELSKAFDATLGLYSPNTIFKDYFFIQDNYVIEEANNQLTIKVDAYETNEANLPNVLPNIEQIIGKSEHRDKFISMSYIQENPTVLNHKSLTHLSIKTLSDIYRNNPVVKSYGQIPYFNDDFIYFQQKTPGVYFLLGGSNIEKNIVAMNHTPNFRVDEECIKIGVKSFSSLIVERINDK